MGDEELAGSLMLPPVVPMSVGETAGSKGDLQAFQNDNSTLDEETSTILGTGAASDQEANIMKNPGLAATNYISVPSLASEIKQAKADKATIFAHVPLITKYDLIGEKTFVFGGRKALQDKIDESFQTALAGSELSAFAKNMDAVRPYISYALAISWNIEFYELDNEKLQGSFKQTNDLQVDVLLSKKYEISERAKAYLGAVYKEGERSQVRGQMRLVEANFENFIIDVRIWCVQSLADVYDMVKNQQRALKKVIDQADLLKQAKQFRQGSKDRNDLIETVMDSRKDMVHHITLLFPIIDKLTTTIDLLTIKMDKGIIQVIRDAKSRTQEEIKMSNKQDRAHDVAKDQVWKNVQKTQRWLAENEKKINQIQGKVNDNARELDANLEKKRMAQMKYQEDLEKINAYKKQLQQNRLTEFANFNAAQKKFAQHLQKMQKKHKCTFNFKKQFIGYVKGCQKSSSTFRQHSVSVCARVLWWCVARASRTSSSYSTQVWTDSECYSKALKEQEEKLKVHLEGERANCRAAQQQFQLEVK